MTKSELPLSEVLLEVVDNRGRTCPTSDSGIPLIATNCISNAELYPTFVNVRYVSTETYTNWFRGHPQSGDIVFVNKGTPGRVCLVPEPVNFCIAQDMVSLRVNQSIVNRDYLFAYLRSARAQKSIAQMHVGTLIPHFKKTDFNRFMIPLPSRAAQDFIGSMYVTISRKIELNRKMNETLEELARAIFKSWFVDFDPVKAKAEGRAPVGMDAQTAALFPDSFQDSERGRIPTGWRASELGQLIENLDSKRVPLSSMQRSERQGIYPYYGAAGQIDSVDDFLFEGIHVLMGEDGSVIRDNGKPYLQYVWDKFWVNNHAHVLKGKDSISNEFVYLLLLDTRITPYVTGAVQPKINQKNMNSISVVLPAPKVSKAFGAISGPLFSLLRANTAEIRTLSELRDTLLPRLISGKLRIPDAEKLLAEAPV